MGLEVFSLIDICHPFGGNLIGVMAVGTFLQVYDWTFISGSHLLLDTSATKHLDGLSTLFY
jgi:hypothetical protein